MTYDLAIVGAGPAGLACAALAAGEGFRVAVVETLAEERLAAPAPDGRDIALTHRSVATLVRLGTWQGIDADEVGPIRRACVRNDGAADLLSLDTAGTGVDALGRLVGNDVLRRELYRKVRATDGIDLITSTEVTKLDLAADGATLGLSTGGSISARLAVAADSRFSAVRRMAGIGAEMRDFGRVCIVCRMSHERPHDGTAYEWFDGDRTLAVLPLANLQSSIVLTLPACDAPAMLAREAGEFATDIERRFAGRWGAMQLVGARHAYPLVAVYAHAFHKRRFALVGDAAVGMHPVTAHGFNFGLRGAVTLAKEITEARRSGGDIGDVAPLAAYDRAHRTATYPLYLATNALVALYADDSLPARIARDALLRVGNAFAPARWLMTRKLTELDEPARVA